MMKKFRGTRTMQLTLYLVYWQEKVEMLVSTVLNGPKALWNFPFVALEVGKVLNWRKEDVHTYGMRYIFKFGYFMHRHAPHTPRACAAARLHTDNATRGLVLPVKEAYIYTLSTFNTMTETRFDVGMTWYDFGKRFALEPRGVSWRSHLHCMLILISHAPPRLLKYCTMQRRMCICSKENSRKDWWSKWCSNRCGCQNGSSTSRSICLTPADAREASKGEQQSTPLSCSLGWTHEMSVGILLACLICAVVFLTDSGLQQAENQLH